MIVLDTDIVTLLSSGKNENLRERIESVEEGEELAVTVITRMEILQGRPHRRARVSKGRLEAFSDGVIAILITIMVFDIKPPPEADLAALTALVPLVLTYLLSFLFLGIYWNNHHHMLHITGRINGTVLWANLHLLFWLSLLPFCTNWLRSSGFATLPAAVYGLDLLAAALAYLTLQYVIIAADPASRLREAIGKDIKGKTSVVLYLVGIGGAFLSPWLAIAAYVLVALIWLVPDRRIESRLAPAAERARIPGEK